MAGETWTLALQLLQIIWIDLLLSGDNAVVIALACRGLPPEQRRMGIVLGAGAAVLLRILFAAIIVVLLGLPYLKLVGGVLLLWIAIQFATEDNDSHDVKAAPSLWGAIRVIAIADGVMSLDNVIAIAAAAHGNLWLIVFGLIVSVPLIVFGAALVMKALDRIPGLVWLGAALLGYVAGELIAADPSVSHHVEFLGPYAEQIVGAAGAVLVVAIAATMRRLRVSAE